MRAKQIFVPGEAFGRIVSTNTPLSFWGGIDPQTGIVIDHHHELLGQDITNCILVMPSGRGSCTGSVVMLECILNEHDS